MAGLESSFTPRNFCRKMQGESLLTAYPGCIVACGKSQLEQRGKPNHRQIAAEAMYEVDDVEQTEEVSGRNRNKITDRENH